MSSIRGDNLDKNIIFQEYFNSEYEVGRNGGDPDVGATSPTFSNYTAIFDGVTARIDYPNHLLHLVEPERAFSIRTRVYLTNTDASVFLQKYISGADSSKQFRFMIGGNWPAVNMNDKFVLELWDNVGVSATEESRGRKYDTALTTLALNKWTEFVATYDGRAGGTPEDGIRLYMDGIRVDDADVVAGAGTYAYMKRHSDIVLQIGQNVEGTMDLVEVYNKALTQEEVTNLYNNVRYKGVDTSTELLSVTGQSGSIVSKYGYTIVDSGHEIRKDGAINTITIVNGTDGININPVGSIEPETFTVLCWVKGLGNPGAGVDSIIASSSGAAYGWGIAYGESSKTIRFAIDDDGTGAWDHAFNSDNEINQHQWYFIACTFDGANMEMYIDDVQQSGGIACSDVYYRVSHDPITIGKFRDGGNRFKGYINDIKIYEGALTRAELSQAYTSSKHKYEK